MSRVVDLLSGSFGGGKNIVVSLMFLLLAVFGFVIAMRGRQLMVWLVGFCGLCVGILGGAMAGLLPFDSFLLMLIFALLGGVGMVLLVKYIKSVGYFIGMGSLSFFIAYMVTSDLTLSNTRITENTWLLFDLAASVLMGILAVIKSKYLVSFITSIAGGVMTSVSVFAMSGSYFADLKMWIFAATVAVLGIIVQIRVYDIHPSKNEPKKTTGRHAKT